MTPRSDEDDPEGALAAAEAFINTLCSAPDKATFDHTALQGLKIQSVAKGRVVCTLPTNDRVLNRYGTLHGGCTATLVDTVSSGALVTVSPYTGVSVSLQVQYMKPIIKGPDVVIDASVVSVGKKLATLQVDLLSNGVLCARGQHIKYLPVADPFWGKVKAKTGNPPRSKL